MSRKNHHKHKTGKGKATHQHQHQHLSKGTLEITRSGIGYVVIADGSGDVLVRPGDFNNALHGDTVRVKVIRENLRSGRKEGRIIEVVSRKQTEFIGTIQMASNFAFVAVDGERPMPDIYVPLDKTNGAQNKDKVVVRMIKWDKEDKKPVGEIVTTMDAGDQNDLAMKEILASNGFPLSFPDDVMEEAERLPEVISESDIQRRKDFREILTFTIDPVDAKDFDDAISIRLLNNGWYEIGVHIADVSHYVEPGSALDEEAYRRATSVYMPDRVNPMLPEKISNELCSLRPHEDKMSFSAVFQMNKSAEIKEFWIGKTVIHSDHRFTYEDVQEIIESGEGKYQGEIFLLNNLAQTMRRERFARGAINFSSQEVRFKLDENAKPIGIVVKESKEAHQLIEEFMLLANRTVASYVAKIKVNNNDLPFPYRVHDQPDEQKLTPFIAFARKYGHKFDISSPEKIADSFNRMLDAARGKPEQHVLEQLGIRTMAKAVYTSDNIGHYGLGFEYYCHFTSPIRRYPDVLVHRIVETCLAGKPEVDKKMEEKCKHSSERERAAMECERSGNKYKQVEYMKGYLGEEFDAVISGVSSFGFWAETVAHKCEGLVHIASLSDYDDFRHNEADYSLDGLRSGRRFRMGDKVRVRVVAANLEKRQLDYEWVLHSTKEETVTPEAAAQLRPDKHTTVAQVAEAPEEVANKPLPVVAEKVQAPESTDVPVEAETKAASVAPVSETKANDKTKANTNKVARKPVVSGNEKAVDKKPASVTAAAKSKTVKPVEKAVSVKKTAVPAKPSAGKPAKKALPVKAASNKTAVPAKASAATKAPVKTAPQKGVVPKGKLSENKENKVAKGKVTKEQVTKNQSTKVPITKSKPAVKTTASKTVKTPVKPASTSRKIPVKVAVKKTTVAITGKVATVPSKKVAPKKASPKKVASKHVTSPGKSSAPKKVAVSKVKSAPKSSVKPPAKKQVAPKAGKPIQKKRK